MTTARAPGLVTCLLINWIVAPQSSQLGDRALLWAEQILEDDIRSNHVEQFRPDLQLETSGIGVAFLNDQQLLVYRLEPSGQLSSRTSHEISSAFLLRLRIVDAHSGKRCLTKDLNASPRGGSIHVTSHSILVNNGEAVNLYSADFTDVRSVTKLPKGDDIWSTNVSPTGRTIMVNGYNPKTNTSHFEIFDADTLTSRGSWSFPPLLHNYSISDRGTATLENQIVITRNFGGASEKVVGTSIGICGGNVPTLYSDDELVYGCTKVVAATVDGHVLMAEKLPEDVRVWAKKAVASGTRRVAVSLHTVQLKKHLLAEPSSHVTEIHIAVFDLNQRKRVLTVSVDPLPKDDYDFAISPDGSKLAVLNDRVVSLYSVPPGAN